MTEDKSRGVKNIHRWQNHRQMMSLLIAISDGISIFLSVFVTLVFWKMIRPVLLFSSYDELIPLILFFIIVYWLVGLYPAVGINPVDEVRRLTIATTVVFLVLGTVSFYLRNVEMWSRASFGISWIVSLVFIPTGRQITRYLTSRLGIWGEPVALVGYGLQGKRMYKLLRQNPKLGYLPELVIGTDPAGEIAGGENVRYITLNELCSDEEMLSGIKTAVVITSDIPKDCLRLITDGQLVKIPYLIMVYPEDISNNIWFSPIDLGGTIGLKLHKNLLIPRQQVFKRISELAIIFISSPILIPLLFFISVLIFIDSPGSVLYLQRRVGKNGKEIQIYKFRTMILDAHQKLGEILELNPDLKLEYEKYKKLKNDPRITRMGKIIRRFSLDEFPQLWNVLKGEMSLVGPRPILFEEIEEYGDSFNKTYVKVTPGMTGLWQVSGRNEVSFQQRVRMDRYYVHNWSIWLDIYIILKTLFQWMSPKGAY